MNRAIIEAMRKGLDISWDLGKINDDEYNAGAEHLDALEEGL